MSAQPADSAGCPELLDKLRERVRDRGCLPFSEFMECALYDPDYGYYSRGPRVFGPRGDFFTASNLGPWLGAALSRQLSEFDAWLGRPDPFRVFEPGAGSGALAGEVLRDLDVRDDGLAGRVRYTTIDRSAGMRDAVAEDPRVERSAPDEVASAAAHGAIVAVELLDAFPVDRFRRRGGAVVEVRVALDARGDLVEREVDANDETRGAIERRGLLCAEADEVEHRPGLAAWFEGIAGVLAAGFMVLVDYGHDTATLRGARSGGTLLAYRGHATSTEYLRRVGEQDLTAHVDWDAAREAAESAGFRFVGSTTQDRFLIANGILDAFESTDDTEWRDPARVRGRLQALQLLHPHGMGRSFQVYVFHRGEGSPGRLRGLQDPFARG